MFSLYLYAFVGISGFFFIAVILKDFILSLADIIIGPLFDLYVYEYSLFGMHFMYDREENNWHMRWGKFLPFFGVLLMPNDANSHEQNKSTDKKILIIRALMLVATGIIFVATCAFTIAKLAGKQSVTLLAFLWLSICAGILFHAVVFLIISICVSLKRNSGLRQEINTLLEKLDKGVPYEELNLVAIEQLPYKKNRETDELIYSYYYMNYLLSLRRFDELKRVTSKVSGILLRTRYNENLAGLYYWMVFYYSRYEFNLANVNIFYPQVAEVLEHDKEPDARRILACYYYGVKKEPLKARQYLNEGIHGVEKMKAGAEKEFQRKLLMELNEFFSRQGF